MRQPDGTGRSMNRRAALVPGSTNQRYKVRLEDRGLIYHGACQIFQRSVPKVELTGVGKKEQEEEEEDLFNVCLRIPTPLPPPWPLLLTGLMPPPPMPRRSSFVPQE